MEGVSPEGVHFARPFLAWQLVSRHQLPAVSSWFEDDPTTSMRYEGHQSTLAPTTEDPGDDGPAFGDTPVATSRTPDRERDENIGSVPVAFQREYDGGQHSSPTSRHDTPASDDGEGIKLDAGSMVRSRPLLTRMAKATSRRNVESLTPGLRMGTDAHDFDADTYIARSFISDVALGIDAGFGLYANRTYWEDSTSKNANVVAFYGGERLTPEETERAINDPNYEKDTT